MAIRSKKELLDSLFNRFGEDSSDETIALLDDFTDTITDLENKALNNNEDWKAKYEENDKAWRKKYTERVLGGNVHQVPDEVVVHEEDNTALEVQVEDLFEEVK